MDLLPRLEDVLAERYHQPADVDALCRRARIPGRIRPRLGYHFWSALFTQLEAGRGPTDWWDLLLDAAIEDRTGDPALQALVAHRDGVRPDPAADEGLTGESQAALADALATCFTEDELRQFLATRTPLRIQDVDWRGSLSQVAYRVVQRATREGCQRLLLDRLLEERPNREDVRALADQIDRSR